MWHSVASVAYIALALIRLHSLRPPSYWHLIAWNVHLIPKGHNKDIVPSHNKIDQDKVIPRSDDSEIRTHALSDQMSNSLILAP